ncbi:hypothetical protein ACLQ22_19770 [Micromonospora sp. DT178]|uniref:hypothetical protein n=1 Tax=Micromonospora sp. DT178 TaxID=3393436 RepID=UPI003CE7639B
MERGAVRARYRQRSIVLMILLTLGLTVAVPVVVANLDHLTWWQGLLFLAVGIPLSWWYLVRLVYRMELTDTHLRLRTLVASSSIALDELAEIGAPAGRNVVKMVRRDGRSWKILSGEGLVDFVNEVGRAAPDAKIRLTGPQLLADRGFKFFGDRRTEGR